MMPVAASIETIIVDDQRSVRALVRASLAHIGITRVTEAEDGAQALSILSIHAKHLIISDLNMPELDGIGLLRAVRNRPATAKTAFIMLTSRADVMGEHRNGWFLKTLGWIAAALMVFAAIVMGILH